MQSNIKDAYIEAQSRMMYAAYMFYSVLCVGLMGLEIFLRLSPSLTGNQVLAIMTIVASIVYTLLAMLIVEVVYQGELQQIPLIASLGRLTPQLSLTQRYAFLAVSVKRQIVSTISIFAFWIASGGTPRGASLTLSMAMITVLTAYGMSYLKENANTLQALEDDDAPE